MKKQVSVRLSDLEVEKLDVLALGGSREGLFKIALRLMAERRVRLNELAIESFRQAQRAASDDADRAKAREYMELIRQYESEIAVLARRKV